MPSVDLDTAIRMTIAHYLQNGVRRLAAPTRRQNATDRHSIIEDVA